VSASPQIPWAFLQEPANPAFALGRKAVKEGRIILDVRKPQILLQGTASNLSHIVTVHNSSLLEFRTMNDVSNPSEPTQSLKRPLNGGQLEQAHLPQQALGEDSAVTKAEKVELADTYDLGSSDPSLPPIKRVKLDSDKTDEQQKEVDARNKVKGVALVKEE
jgi:hypothetical protein